MTKKIKNFLFIFSFFLLTFLVIKKYVSETNVVSTNKLRNSYSLNQKTNDINLPILENDTKNVIIYKNDLENFNENRKKRFWEKLISGKQ
tara:strand:- start:89 stop:358 length:270 start_codon:yes stop_codon:yes gene_type:complete